MYTEDFLVLLICFYPMPKKQHVFIKLEILDIEKKNDVNIIIQSYYTGNFKVISNL